MEKGTTLDYLNSYCAIYQEANACFIQHYYSQSTHFRFIRQNMHFDTYALALIRVPHIFFLRSLRNHMPTNEISLNFEKLIRISHILFNSFKWRGVVLFCFLRFFMFMLCFTDVYDFILINFFVDHSILFFNRKARFYSIVSED